MILAAGHAQAQTNRTWNGSVNSDWFNPTNWTPAGVPASNDIINFTNSNGTINFTAPVTLDGQFNWSAGTLSGSGLTIASNGVMNINGSTTLFLECPLTNFGTVTWASSALGVLNNGGAFASFVENMAGGLFDIQCDQNLFNNTGGTTYFHNVGTLRKSANTGTTSVTISIINAGTVTGLEGTLNFGAGGVLAGTFQAASNAAINFSGGSFTNSGPASIVGPGSIQLTGSGNLFLLSDAIANLTLAGGTVNLGPAFQGGTITNLTIAGATLAGTNTLTGTFNFNNGAIASGSLTIASNGVMNINGSTTLFLQCPLTNFGTVTWLNNALGVLNNGGAPDSAVIENLGLFDIRCDQSLFNNVGVGNTTYFHNVGTLRKSANTGITTVSISILNSGTVAGLAGTLNFGGGGMIGGTFQAATNAAVNFTGGNFTNSGPASILGPGTVQLTGSGNLFLLSDVIPDLALAGGTVNLGPAFQGGTITNLTIAGATLTGTNTVTGTFNFNNGAIAGASLTVASNGVLNINGSTTLFLECPLTNFGTVTWLNNAFGVLNNGGADAGVIENMPGGLFDIQCDQNLFNNVGGTAYFHNTGTLQKSALTGTTFLSIPVTNSGTISALSGILSFQNGFTPQGGVLQFGLSSSSSFGTANISGAATLGGTVGVVWLGGFVPASGDVYTVLTYGSHSGIFTNVVVPPSGAVWVTNYGATSFTMSVASINKLAFTTQPVGGKLTNVIIAPVVVQIEDPSNNPVAVGGVPITVGLDSGSGIMNGTLTQLTDSSGKSTFSDLSFSAFGPKTLHATSSGLTTAISVPFQIEPLVGLQTTNTGFLIQLNGNNNHGTTTISASTNLVTWIPIFTNAPTNGPILFLDTSATNFRARFYKIVEQ